MDGDPEIVLESNVKGDLGSSCVWGFAIFCFPLRPAVFDIMFVAT
jgi:hypothetical protein